MDEGSGLQKQRIYDSCYGPNLTCLLYYTCNTVEINEDKMRKVMPKLREGPDFRFHCFKSRDVSEFSNFTPVFCISKNPQIWNKGKTTNSKWPSQIRPFWVDVYIVRVLNNAWNLEVSNNIIISLMVHRTSLNFPRFFSVLYRNEIFLFHSVICALVCILITNCLCGTESWLQLSVSRILYSCQFLLANSLLPTPTLLVSYHARVHLSSGPSWD